ncbi:Uncharacterized protein BM_BM8953 [Brugia malayi]|uniref:Uncharacterized protein n=1 Tax=Brugia malayi TaxID=6279 RepID=A0A4E9FBV2_BRUMA|nr:Uncharacterized protein BM_BM8953 [Brugia malayi]VIO94375.1 Uncharacterized protein BM_BM8953 [Brugia malayi]
MPPLNSRQKFPQESKGQKIQKRKNSSIFQKNFTVEQKNNSGTTIKAIRTIDEHFSIDEHHVIYTGISNEIATKLVLMLMGFMVTLILLCIFLILSIYIYYKEKDEEFFLDNKGEPAKVKVDKAHSPYIITPEQKITQQLLSTEMVTSIGCSVDDIAQLLRYIALYGELSEDEIYQTPLTFIRLVVRGKTKFDKDDSKREQKPVPKSESKLGLYNDKEYLIKRYNTSARYIPQNFCNSLFQEKKTRGNELSNRLISDNKVKRSSRRGNAMRKGKRKKNRKKKSSKSRLSRQLVEAASPHAHERMLNKGLRMKRSRKVRGLRRKENGKHFNS